MPTPCSVKIASILLIATALSLPIIQIVTQPERMDGVLAASAMSACGIGVVMALLHANSIARILALLWCWILMVLLPFSLLAVPVEGRRPMGSNTLEEVLIAWAGMAIGFLTYLALRSSSALTWFAPEVRLATRCSGPK